MKNLSNTIDAYLLAIQIYLEGYSFFNIKYLENYAATHSGLDFFVFLCCIYFGYIYGPIRMISAVFFRRWYKKYVNPNIFYAGISPGFPTQVGLHRLVRSFNMGEKICEYGKPMPLWMDIIAFSIVLTEFVILCGGMVLLFIE